MDMMQDSSSEAARIWTDLSAGVNTILAKAGEDIDATLYMTLYTHVYDFCASLRPAMPGSTYYTPADMSTALYGSVYGRQLYTRLTDHVSQYMGEVAKRATAFKGDELLTFYNREWVRYGDAAKMIHNIFGYLNRHWIQREKDEGNNVCDINTLMFRLWRNQFFMDVRGALLESVFSLMTRIRDGQVADLGLVKSVVDSFVSLGSDDLVLGSKKMEVYDAYFLKPFIEGTRRYYQAESERMLKEGSIRSYMAWVFDRIKEEEDRAELYLHESSLREFSEALNKVLIGKQREQLSAEFHPMLEAQEREDLRRLYLLLKRLGDGAGLEPMRNLFGAFVKSAGLEAVKRISSDQVAAESLTNKARLFVDALLSVHDLYADILRGSFEDDPGFSKALDHACKEFINTNAVCVSDETNAARLLASHCDTLLKKGNATARAGPTGAEGASSEDNLEFQLSQAVCVFRYLKDQDMFQAAYWRFFARRLINEQSVSSHGEATMISKLKEVIGVDFKTKLSTMFSDITVSKDMTEQFREPGRASSAGPPAPFDIGVKVLNTGSWPFKAPDTKLTLPPELSRVVDQFTQFYQDKHSGRRLNWLWQYSKADLKVFFPGATGAAAKTGYVFTVSTYQLAILLLFNADSGPGTGYGTEAGPSLTLAQIMAATELDRDLVESEMDVFCKARVLTSSTGKVSDDARFALNGGFKSKKLRMNLAGLKRPDQKREANEIQRAVDTDRLVKIQAAIVRIMKARKQLSHRELVETTIAHIKLFQPQVSDIKQAIDKLIDTSYIERDESSRDLYNYLA
ncbi:ubiquitin ligase (cullin) of SCF [Coemansia biformis]|uniref:Cullin-5 n=1 Tax=Coemansia biformis TaxID=1286918 RepID=A0A9W7YH34_9FUNG|nr:ubiquitin ligase (cullin) of SCF [Coemansia biformis]